MQVQANQGTGLEALFKRGFYARLQGDLDKASEDLNAGMQLFALHHPVLPYATLNCSIRGLPMVGTVRPVHAKPWKHGGCVAKQFDN